MITYLPSNGVYKNDGNKQIRADGHDKVHTLIHAHNFSSQSSEVLYELRGLKLSKLKTGLVWEKI